MIHHSDDPRKPVMKNQFRFLLTHGAVFSMGIVAALVANGFRGSKSTQAGADRDLSSRTSSSHISSMTQSGDPARVDGTGRDKPHSIAQKNQKPATERLASLVRITDPFERQRALMDLVDSLSPGEFAGVAEQFRELDHLGDTRGEYSMILGAWAKIDPLAAIEYVGRNPNSQRGSATVLATWAGIDPAAAERWALANHEGDDANPYMVAVIQGIAGNDIANASRLAQTMPRSNERGEATAAITRALFMQGIDAAMAFPDSIPDETLRGTFVSQIAKRLIEKDVDQAAAWITAMPQGEVQNRAAREVADALARVNPDKAAKWVSSLKPEAQAEAARGVIPLMSANDIPGTAKWVSGMNGTPHYDSMVEEFVWSCDVRAPEQSAAWIQAVSDPNQQRRLYHRMLGQWASKDAAAVKQWVTSNQVPEDVVRRFAR
jgi:hypothetical protein